MPTRDDLRMMRALPLNIKIRMTETRIREWVNEFGTDGVYISFSGGKDSTVLLFIARRMYPNIPAVFCNTGLEYPEIQKFVKHNDGIEIIRPKMTFRQVLEKYGYPVIGKEVAEYVYTVRHSKGEKYVANRLARLNGTFRRKDGKLSQYNRPQYKYLLFAPFEISSVCCTEMKKKPFNEYSKRTGRVPIMATMTEESRLREGKWLKTGCNSFHSKHPNSTPMAFWTEQDVLRFLFTYHSEMLEFLEKHFYDEGFTQEEIEKIKYEHPWATCYKDIVPYQEGAIDGQMLLDEVVECGDCKFRTTGCKRTGCIFCFFGITQDPERMLRTQDMEPKIADYILRGGMINENGMWQPSPDGMGLWFVIEWLCAHGNLKIPYRGRDTYIETYGSEWTNKQLTDPLDIRY